LPQGLTLATLQARPDSVKLLVRKTRVSAISEIVTEPLLLDSVNETGVFKLKLLLSNEIRLVDETQNLVRVTAAVESKKIR
jgi:hypothetical protein